MGKTRAEYSQNAYTSHASAFLSHWIQILANSSPNSDIKKKKKKKKRPCFFAFYGRSGEGNITIFFFWPNLLTIPNLTPAWVLVSTQMATPTSLNMRIIFMNEAVSLSSPVMLSISGSMRFRKKSRSFRRAVTWEGKKVYENKYTLKPQDSSGESNNKKSWSSESAGNHQKTPSDLPAIVLNDIL